MSKVTANVGFVKSTDVLPVLPDGLVYKVETYNNQQYISTGGFNPGASTRQRPDLRWLGTLIVDFDLVDWLGHVEAWSGDKASWKQRMYARYAADTAALADVKERHLDDVKAVLDNVLDNVHGSSGPTFLVDSGWGVHAYFWLENPVQGAGLDVARMVNKRLVESINTEAGYDIADKGVHDAGTRIIRQVGSVNTQALEKAGLNAPMPVVVIESHPAATWELDETQFGGVSRPVSTPISSTPSLAVSTASTSAAEDELRVRLNSMRAWLLARKGLGELYDACTNDQTSEADMSLASALAARRVPVVYISQIVHLARGFTTQHEGTDYWDRTAISAWSHVRGVGQSVSADDNYGMMHPAALLRFEPGMSTMRQVSLIAQHDPRISRMLWVHEHTRHIEWATDAEGEVLIGRFFDYIQAPVPPLRNGKREFDDQHSLKLVQWFEQIYGSSCVKDWRESMGMVVSALPKRNPLQDYLEACGVALDTQRPDLLETWLLRAFPGLEDTPLLRAYSKKWLVGGVARAIDPGVFVKAMLVIVGGQSAGKTTLFRYLGGEFYDSPHTKDLLSKDSIMASNYSWLLEMEEMDFLSKNTVESIKKYITTQSDRVRLPYGRDMTTLHRACFYAGTANRADILSDGTGNDRFWCIELPEGALCDFRAVSEMRDTLWGQAYRAWMKVRDLPQEDRIAATNLTRDELALLRAKNQEFERTDAVAETVAKHAWKAVTNRRDDTLPLRVSWPELTAVLFPSSEHRATNIMKDLDKATEWRVKGQLEALGFKMTRKRAPGADRSAPLGARMWYAPESWNERYKALLQMAAENPRRRLLMPDSVDDAPVEVPVSQLNLTFEAGLIPIRASTTEITVN